MNDITRKDLSEFLRIEIDSLLAHFQKRGLDMENSGLVAASMLGHLARASSDNPMSQRAQVQQFVIAMKAASGVEDS